MNGGQVMVVLIVMIVMIASVIKGKHRRHPGTDLMERPKGDQDGETRALRHEVQQMKERIQVLERVITDNHKSVDLDREIERLRDR
ncbi:hypothetical protein [uncultured Sphingomonas sp.]|uniref:hypothetical protein n=1 Tax=Sphingomonas sp. TaxID=28214 RepID=UPI002607816B|nr:hypothetical protein [uncultured Sphingomonas sp.]